MLRNFLRRWLCNGEAKMQIDIGDLYCKMKTIEACVDFESAKINALRDVVHLHTDILTGIQSTLQSEPRLAVTERITSLERHKSESFVSYRVLEERIDALNLRLDAAFAERKDETNKEDAEKSSDTPDRLSDSHNA